MSGEIPRNPMKKTQTEKPGLAAFLTASFIIAVIGVLAVQFAWNIGIASVADVNQVNLIEAAALTVGVLLLRIVMAGANPGAK